MTALPRPAAGERGFTLVEVLVAALIGAVVLMLATRTFLEFAAKNVKLARATDMGTSAKAFTSQFTAMAERGEVALQFEKLPISTGACTGVRPCLRQISIAGTFNTAAAPAGFASLMNFFVDETADLQPVHPIAGDLSTTNKTPLPVNVPASTVAAGDLYMTWILEDESSPAFVMMHSIPENAYMTLDASTRSLWPYADQLYRMRAENNTLDPDQVRDQLAVLYNAADPKQYMVRVVDSAVLCAGGAPAPTCAGASANHWQIGLKPISADANFAAGFVPTAAGLGGITIGASMQFDDGNYLFPSTIASLYNSAAAHAAAVYGDPRGLAYVLTDATTNQPPNLILAPVQMTALYLRKVAPTLLAKDTYYSLVMSDYLRGTTRASNERTVIDRLPMTCAGGTCRGKVIIGRKVGTTEIGVWIYKPDDVLVSAFPIGRLREMGRRFAATERGVGRQPWLTLGSAWGTGQLGAAQ